VRNREQLNDLLSELFLFTPLSEAEIERIRYVALEMIENAMEWGNRRQRELLVTISYQVTNEYVKFVIRDEGTGFNPGQLPHAACLDDPCAHLDIREKLGLRNGGFGILIAKGIMDEVRYNDRGNEVTLVKHFNGHASATTSTTPSE
jgi:two-component system, OmpR family, response regulator